MISLQVNVSSSHMQSLFVVLPVQTFMFVFHEVQVLSLKVPVYYLHCIGVASQ